MNSIASSNLKNKDKLYKKIFDLFPYSFYKRFRKWIVIYSLVFLVITIVYLIVATYLNQATVWICLTIPLSLLVVGSFVLTEINVEWSIKKFKTNFYLNQKEITHKDDFIVIRIKRGKLFEKRTNFILALINQVYEQVNNQM